MRHLSLTSCIAAVMASAFFACKKPAIPGDPGDPKGGGHHTAQLVLKQSDSLSTIGKVPKPVVVSDKIFFPGAMADMYNASTGKWDSVQLAATFNAAGVIGNKVIMAAGTIAQVYDASTGQLTTVDTFTHVDRRYDIGVSAGSKVLFAGGSAALCCSSGAYPVSADIYDVSTGKVINSQLSRGRTQVAGAAAGNKILIAAGTDVNSHTNSVVDIYDVSTGLWTVSSLSQPRDKPVGVTVGNKILFVGGKATEINSPTDLVDIYDATTGQWTVAHLSARRSQMGIAVAGDLVFFGGGGTYTNEGRFSKRVDIYNTASNQWDTASLSEARGALAAAVVGNKVVFAGGFKVPGYPGDTWGNGLVVGSKTVDVYDLDTHKWSVTSLSVERGLVSAAAAGNKLIVAGGYKSAFNSDPDLFDNLATPLRTADVFELK